MVALYIASSENAVGKTMLCAGIGRHLMDDGKKVGLLKPLVTDSKTSEAADRDAVFMKGILALKEPVQQLCPVKSVKDAYDKVSKDKDIIIVEGNGLDKASHEIVEALGAKVIVIEGYSNQATKAQSIDKCKEFGNLLLGVVANKVPRNRLEQVRKETSAEFGKAGMDILGVLPEDRTLLALTVAELAENIQGKTLNHSEKSSELVENVMLGAKAVDPGPEYFSRKTNKAVVVRSGRPDMQLAALETPTTCLVLSGDTPPIPSVLYGAETGNVPIISTETDIDSIVAGIEDALSKSRFNQEAKLARLAELLEEHFDFQALYKGLELKTK